MQDIPNKFILRSEFQPTGDQQFRIESLSVLPKIAKVPLAPYADGTLFFEGNGQTREIIVPVQFVPESVFLIKNLILHDSFLPFCLESRFLLLACCTAAAEPLNTARSGGR